MIKIKDLHQPQNNLGKGHVHQCPTHLPPMHTTLFCFSHVPVLILVNSKVSGSRTSVCDYTRILQYTLYYQCLDHSKEVIEQED